MNEQQNTTDRPEVKQKNQWTAVAMIILLLLAIGGTGYAVYAWQQNDSLSKDLLQQKENNKKLSDENTTQKNEAKTEMSDQELAQKAAQNFVDAQVLDMKYVALAPEVKGDFASSGVAPSSKLDHIVKGLLLKKIDGTWIVIHEGQNGPSQDIITRFAVPEEFRS